VKSKKLRGVPPGGIVADVSSESNLDTPDVKKKRKS
jgi:hypothetical protein